MSRLEQMIKDHRGEFDTLEPSDRLWTNINARIRQHHGSLPKRAWPRYLWWGGTLLLVLGVYFGFRVFQEDVVVKEGPAAIKKENNAAPAPSVPDSVSVSTLLAAKDSQITLLKQQLEKSEEDMLGLKKSADLDREKTRALMDVFRSTLLGPGNKEGLNLRTSDGKIYVSMDAQLLFPSGKAEVDSVGKAALLRLCGALQKDTSFYVIIEGHTDDQPIHTHRFEDNWDLSVLRAAGIARILCNEGGMDPHKVIPSGRAQFAPVDGTGTEEARARNRRIELIIAPNLQTIMDLLEH